MIKNEIRLTIITSIKPCTTTFEHARHENEIVSSNEEHLVFKLS